MSPSPTSGVEGSLGGASPAPEPRPTPNRPGGAVRCTLITPLYNERDNIERTWSSILNQTRPPDEWIVTDNGSTDGTYEWLGDRQGECPFPFKLLPMPDANIAQMMNTAVREATHDIVACCHGGLRIPQTWLENLLAPLAADASVDVAAGMWEPYGETWFERFVARGDPHRIDRLDPATYLPASRSLAFRKTAWAHAGGFPEWLPLFGEDTLYAIRLRAAGCRFALARDAVVGWRPKGSVVSLFRQVRRYAEGNAAMGYVRHPLRAFLSPSGFVPLGVAVGLAARSYWLGLAGFAAACVGFEALRCVVRGMLPSISGLFVSGVLLGLARQVGYVRGYWWRLVRAVRVPQSDKKAVADYLRLWRRGGDRE